MQDKRDNRYSAGGTAAVVMFAGPITICALVNCHTILHIHGTAPSRPKRPPRSLLTAHSLPLSTQFVRPSVGLSFLAFSFHSKPTITTYDLTESAKPLRGGRRRAAPALSQNLIPSNFLQTRTASLDLHEPVAGIGALILDSTPFTRTSTQQT